MQGGEGEEGQYEEGGQDEEGEEYAPQEGYEDGVSKLSALSVHACCPHVP